MHYTYSQLCSLLGWTGCYGKEGHVETCKGGGDQIEERGKTGVAREGGDIHHYDVMLWGIYRY
jgi:hypothetical protein